MRLVVSALCVLVLFSCAGDIQSFTTCWFCLNFTYTCIMHILLIFWFILYHSCLWSFGSKRKRNNQMGCNVLDTRWLCGKHKVHFYLFLFFKCVFRCPYAKIDFEIMWLMFGCFYSKSKLVGKLRWIFLFNAKVT